MAAAGNNSLNIETLKPDDITLIVKITGPVIDNNVKALQKKLERIYKKNVPKIILDVSGISFLNSMGLGAIVYLHTLMEKSGRKLLILNSGKNPSKFLNDLFEMTNLNKVLNIIR